MMRANIKLVNCIMLKLVFSNCMYVLHTDIKVCMIRLINIDRVSKN